MTLRYTKKPLRNTEGEKISVNLTVMLNVSQCNKKSELNSSTPKREIGKATKSNNEKVKKMCYKCYFLTIYCENRLRECGF
ncbi:hypothetical protein D0T57_00815 [Dysgonomonas sp. 511]|nr:hypothetical protein [Dysgonomonas sp. 511]